MERKKNWQRCRPPWPPSPPSTTRARSVWRLYVLQQSTYIHSTLSLSLSHRHTDFGLTQTKRNTEGGFRNFNSSFVYNIQDDESRAIDSYSYKGSPANKYERKSYKSQAYFDMIRMRPANLWCMQRGTTQIVHCSISLSCFAVELGTNNKEGARITSGQAVHRICKEYSKSCHLFRHVQWFIERTRFQKLY